LITFCKCKTLVCTESFLESFNEKPMAEEIIFCDKEQLEKLSTQKSAQNAIAVFYQIKREFTPDMLINKLSIALDTVQDPGNLGTIIRIADWFGIEHVVCSRETVEVYNQKTIQATMGALGRVQVHYADLYELLKNTTLPVYGTFLDGVNLYEEELTPHGIIVMGNEGNGISQGIEELVSKKLLIPGYPDVNPICESLNVGVATSIICAEFRRRFR
ncbi:MAG: RNA methyltransferase, partial [Bacteroidales bacterium]